MYDFVTVISMPCTTGGKLRRRIDLPVALVEPNGSVMFGPGTGPSVAPREDSWVSFHGQLRRDGHASGTLILKIAHVLGNSGRRCSSGTIRWTAAHWR